MTESQIEVSTVLRNYVMAEVDRRALTDDDLARMLDVFPDGVRRLRHQKVWPVETALMVIDRLGLKVRVEVGTH